MGNWDTETSAIRANQSRYKLLGLTISPMAVVSVLVVIAYQVVLKACLEQLPELDSFVVTMFF